MSEGLENKTCGLTYIIVRDLVTRTESKAQEESKIGMFQRANAESAFAGEELKLLD